MAVLARLKIAPNQRLDLPDVLAFDAYAAGDWKYFLATLTGGRAVIVKGFEIFQPNTLIGNPAGNVDVVVADSSLWWPNGSEGSFYASLPTEANRSVTLITNATNYIEMTLTLSSKAEDARALWDPGANGGQGGEFTQVIDTEYYLDIEITRNNTGFSSDKIPIAKVVVNSSNNVVSITDSRNLLFRLASGGANPDPVNDFSWKDDPLGFSRTDTAVTMTSPTEENVFRGADKNINNLKDWMDAVMTRIKELAGQPKWFAPAPGSPSMPLSLSQLFLDSQSGHSMQPDRDVSIAWSKNNDGKLRSENSVGVNRQVSWKSNFGQLFWNLGGTFVSSSNREYSSFAFEKSVSPDENLYISLQRDASINGDPFVTFENISGSTAYVSSASTGAFTGVAVGDYIRKASSTIDQYYKVQELRVSAGTPFTNGTTEGAVANATVQYVVLVTHDGPISTTVEKFKYFRSRYQASDLFTATVGELDPNNYWIGRRNGDMFYLRDYGDMQPGEEVETLNDSETQEHGGGADLILERANDAVYDPVTGFSLKGGGITTLLTIRRRLLDNTVGTPSTVDNSDASLTYTVAAPIGTIPDGFGLWVRLDNASGVLANGDVTNVYTDNVWEVRDPIDNPLRTYDNRNVFLIARKFTINSVQCLIFSDGVMMSYDGQWVNNHLSVQSDLFLKNKTQWSVPFIGTTGGRVDENNSQFFWNNESGNDSLGVLGVRNLRITEDTANKRDIVDQDVAQDHHFLPNIGSHTIQVGGSNATIFIPGDLVVDGNSTSVNTVILQSDDKIVSLGVGNIANGGYGSGIEVADDTRIASQIDSVSGQSYIDISYSSAHSYALGDELNVDSNVACGGVTAGQMNGSYVVVASGFTSGDAQVISSTVLRVYTTGTATSASTVSLAPPTSQVRTYKAPWSTRVGSSDGTYSGITSWVFRVKNQVTAPTLTPVSSYGIVPTAHSSNMQAMRIPFVNDDSVGPSGADTTINFTGNLTWNNSTTTLTIGGDVVPMTDNTYDIGKYNLRWKTLHVGPGSVVVHNDATDVNKITLGFTGSTATLISNSATPINVAVNGHSGVNFDIGGRIGILDSAASNIGVNIAGSSNITQSSSQRGLSVTVPLSASTDAVSIYSQLSLSSVAATNGYGLRVANPTLSSSTLASSYGVYIDDLTAATNDYGVYSAITSGSNKWFLYGNGNAISYFAGNIGIGNSTQASINAQRLLLGTTSDTTSAGGMNFGTDTNLYRSAANTLKTDDSIVVATNVTIGLETLTTNARLNVVDSSSADAVRITQTGSGNALVVEDEANPDSTPFVIDTNGRVLVGSTLAYSTYLSGFTNNYINYFQINGIDFYTSTASIAQWSTSTTTSGGSFLSLNKSNNAVVGSHTVVNSGQRLGGIGFAGSDGTKFAGAVDIYGEVDGTPSAGSVPGRLILSTTAPSGTSPTERMRINSAGLVTVTGNQTINSSNSVNALKITQTGTGNALLVEDEASADSTPFVIDSSGQVIVGTASAFDFSKIQVTSGGITIGTYTNDNSSYFFSFKKSKSTIPGNWSSVSFGTTLSNLSSYGDDGSSFIEASRISTIVDTTPAANSMPGSLVFYTTSSGQSFVTERMRINSSGNAGIGVSPTYRLDVAMSGSGLQIVQRLQNTVSAANNSGAQTVYAANRTTSGLTNIAGIGGIITDISDSAYKGALVLSTANNAAPVERMRIDSNGKVGIATTSPTALLHVSKQAVGASVPTNYPLLVSGDASNNPRVLLASTNRVFYLDVINTGSNSTSYAEFSTFDYASSVPFQMALQGNGGSVNIGTNVSSWPSLFNVGSSAQFQVNSTGNIVKLNDITTSFPSAQGAANTFLKNDGAGNLTWTNATYWGYKASNVTGNYTVQADDMVIPVDTSANSSDITMTLPLAATAGIGKVYIFKDVGGQCSRTGKRIIISRSGSDTIDAATTATMENDYVSFTLVSSGSAWFIV